MVIEYQDRHGESKLWCEDARIGFVSCGEGSDLSKGKEEGLSAMATNSVVYTPEFDYTGIRATADRAV